MNHNVEAAFSSQNITIESLKRDIASLNEDILLLCKADTTLLERLSKLENQCQAILAVCEALNGRCDGFSPRIESLENGLDNANRYFNQLRNELVSLRAVSGSNIASLSDPNTDEINKELQQASEEEVQEFADSWSVGYREVIHQGGRQEGKTLWIKYYKITNELNQILFPGEENVSPERVVEAVRSLNSEKKHLQKDLAVAIQQNNSLYDRKYKQMWEELRSYVKHHGMSVNIYKFPGTGRFMNLILEWMQVREQQYLFPPPGNSPPHSG